MATRKLTTHLSTLIAAAALVACGGGGGDAPAEQPVVVTPGLYVGTTNTGGDFVAFAIENGDIWATYVVGNVGGMFQGNPSAGGVKDYGYSPAQPASINFTSASATSVAGTASDSTGKLVATFSGNKPAGYEYNQPVVVSTIAGHWAGIPASTGENLTFDITAGGAITGISSGGCEFTGVVAPHGNKNLYDLAITFGAAPCDLPGISAKGIANGDESTLVVMLVDNSKQYGLLAVGSR